MLKSKLALFLIAGMICSMLSGADLTNLALKKGVRYRYLDADLKPMSADGINGGAYQDPEHRKLNDGKINGYDPGAVRTEWKSFSRKAMRVLYEFPAEITANSAEIAWMWAENKKKKNMWFDTVNVYAGSKPGEYRRIATIGNPGDGKQHVPVKIDFGAPVKGRFFLFEIIQEPHEEHFMFIISEIAVFGPASQGALIDAAFSRKLAVSVKRNYPSNLFESGKDVRMEMVLGPLPSSGKITLKTRLKDYFGNLIEENTERVPQGTHLITWRQLPDGYYEFEAFAETEGKSPLKGSTKTSFIVAPLTRRSAEEAIAAGCRFGIQGGFAVPESLDAFLRLGLHWYRELLCYAPLVGNDPEKPDFSYMEKEFLDKKIRNRPVIAMFEVKTVPQFCYTPEHWIERTKKKKWIMPDYPERFVKFISDQIKKVPRHQKHFEIWNEPPYPPEDFAKLCEWVERGIRAVRPDAVIGPNTGLGQYMVKVAEKGGFRNMDMVTIHPYANGFISSPEASGLRQTIRDGRALVKRTLGRDLPIYVTEIGWPTPKAGPSVNTEAQQAAYIVRAGLGLFAEDVKGIMPYCVGQPERDPKEREHFFGFVRKDLTPKPVLAAYANMARLLEGSRFIGDLWLGTDIGAMLFEKKGVRFLALYSDGKTQKIMIRPGVKSLKLMDIMGKTEKIAITENRLSLTLTDNPIYLIGVSPEFDAKIMKRIPREKQWSRTYKPTVRESLHAADADAAFHGNQRNCKITGANIPEKESSAEYGVFWNETHLFVDVFVRDQTPALNPFSGQELWKGDAVELFLSLHPERDIPGFLRDWNFQIFLAPKTGNGKSAEIFGVCGRSELRGRKVKGVNAEYEIGKDFWRVKAAIPFSALGEERVPETKRLRLEVAVDNLGKKHSRFQLNSNDQYGNSGNPALWSELVLKPQSGSSEKK